MIFGQSRENQPSVHIIGAGALGANIAMQLPFRCQLVGQHNGVRLVGRKTASGQSHDQATRQAIDVKAWEQVQGIKTAIVCCKVLQLAKVCEQLKPRLNEQSTVISLCNGMGYEALLVSLPGHYLPGVTTAAAWRDGDQIELVSNGETKLGGQIQPPAWLSATTWQWHDDIASERWLKLAINALINPLTVLANAPNGQLTEPLWQQRQLTLANELEQLVAGERLSLPPLFDTAQRVCQATAANISSSLQDSRAQRATELPWICGFVMQRAAAHGLAMPHYSAMCKELEDKGYATQLV